MEIKLENAFSVKFNQAESPKNNEDVALEFERIFAQRMVQEMTKGLFENDDNKPMAGASNGLYRQHIVDTLATELAEQQQLGIGDMIKRYLDERNGL